MERNILGSGLEACCHQPKTGFLRDGFCKAPDSDYGKHWICAVVTDEFLSFTQLMGNDLTRPGPGFPGLKAGDCWCLCVSRWIQAKDAGCAPMIKPKSTHIRTLEYVSYEILEEYFWRQEDE